MAPTLPPDVETAQEAIVDVVEVERTVDVDEYEGKERNEQNHQNLIRPAIYKFGYRFHSSRLLSST